MSASREKKQRQGSGPSERNVQAQQQAAAYKRKVRRYTIIGVVVVVLVAALLFWDSGIIQRNQTALTVGDAKYTVNDVGFYYYDTRYSAQLSYYYMGTTPPSDDAVMNAESGQTYHDYYLEEATNALTSITAIYNEAVKNGYSDKDVADEVQSEIDSLKASAASSGYSYAAYLKAQYGRYMTPAAYKAAYTRQAVAEAYFADYRDALDYTDEQVQAYYNEHKDDLDTYEYSYLYFTPEAVSTTDEEGNDLGLSDEEKEALTASALADAKALAESAVSDLESGADVSALISRTSPASSGDHSVNVGSNSAIPSVIKDTLFGMKDGDVELVENGTSGFYAVILHARTLPQDSTADVRHILIRAETTTDDDGNTVAPTDEAWADAQAETERILNEYKSGAQTEEAFGALAEQYSSDTGSNTNGGLYTGVYHGQFVSEFDSWLFDSARAPGDVDIIRHAPGEGETGGYYGYHIVYYVKQSDPVWVNTSKNALRSEDVTEWRDGLTANYTAELTSAADYLG